MIGEKEKIKPRQIGNLGNRRPKMNMDRHPLDKGRCAYCKEKEHWARATGQKQYLWTTSRTVDLGRGQVTHSFLVIPERPIFIRKRLANEAEGPDRVYSNQAGGD